MTKKQQVAFLNGATRIDNTTGFVYSNGKAMRIFEPKQFTGALEVAKLNAQALAEACNSHYSVAGY